MNMLLKTSFIFCLFNFVLLSPAYAYLDPGISSIILQSFLATIAAVGATYRLWIAKVKEFFKKKFKK